jgi:suppressor of ftsI
MATRSGSITLTVRSILGWLRVSRSARLVLGGLVAAPLIVAGCSGDDAADAPSGAPAGDDPVSELAEPVGGGALPVPPLLEPTTDAGVDVFRLEATRGRTSFLGDHRTDTMGYNGGYLGPTVRVTEGDQVRMEVTNHLGEDTTVHWHGLHVPPTADGGPTSVIADGDTWTPEFTVRQQAASLWYHPHPMGQTTRQVGMGLAGMFIVDDASAAQAALPHDYGVNDFPLVLQSQYFDADGQVLHVDVEGMDTIQDQVAARAILANGTASPVLDSDRSRVRLRIVNASTTEFLTLAFADGTPFTWVASDGGLLPAPLEATDVRLGPADRIEIVVDVTGDRTLQATVDQGTGGQDGDGPDADEPQDQRDANEPEDETEDDADPEFLTESVDVLQIQAPDAAEPPAGDLPERLSTVDAFDLSGARVSVVELTGSEETRDLGINGVSMTSMSDLDHSQHALHVRQGEVVVWDVRNDTNDEHNFHVHDQQFQVVSLDGAPPPVELGGRQDTIPIPPGATARIALRFDDYADPTTGYMVHCHLLPHEDGGMSTVLYVEPPNDATATRTGR